MVRRVIISLFILGLTLSPAAWATDEISYSGSATIGTGVFNAGAAQAFIGQNFIRVRAG